MRIGMFQLQISKVKLFIVHGRIYSIQMASFRINHRDCTASTDVTWYKIAHGKMILHQPITQLLSCKYFLIKGRESKSGMAQI